MNISDNKIRKNQGKYFKIVKKKKKLKNEGRLISNVKIFDQLINDGESPIPQLRVILIINHRKSNARN